jgi:hypothetical protein
MRLLLYPPELVSVSHQMIAAGLGFIWRAKFRIDQRGFEGS